MRIRAAAAMFTNSQQDWVGATASFSSKDVIGLDVFWQTEGFRWKVFEMHLQDFRLEISACQSKQDQQDLAMNCHCHKIVHKFTTTLQLSPVVLYKVINAGIVSHGLDAYQMKQLGATAFPYKENRSLHQSKSVQRQIVGVSCGNPLWEGPRPWTPQRRAGEKNLYACVVSFGWPE